MFEESDAALPQRIGHLLISIDPERLDSTPGAARDRLDRLAVSVEAGGGRLPGARRTLPDDVDEDAPLELAPQTVAELADWAERLGVTTELDVTA
jgi:(2R)-3-sulfolactate dehydrogenase (NADP+)